MVNLTGTYAKLDRAKEHVRELDRIVTAFLDTHPYLIDSQKNLSRGEFEWILISARDIPLRISTVAGDALQNLRTVLDHLVYQLIIANGKTPHATQAGFPICESAEKYATRESRRKIEGMSQAAIDAVNAFKPYAGGNDLLWALHRLNNMDKHRMLFTAVAAMAAHDILPAQRAEIEQIFSSRYPNATRLPEWKGVRVRPETARFPLKVGEVFFSLPESQMEDDFTFRTDVSFNEPGIPAGEPIIESVNKFVSLVAQIVGIFASRF